MQQRVRSITNPTKITDSNEHRRIVCRTGWQMIKAHPLFGVGPERFASRQCFIAYLPTDIQRPLPAGYYEHLHNIYIHYAAECGVPAALFLTAAFGDGDAGFPPGDLSRCRPDVRTGVSCCRPRSPASSAPWSAGMLEKNLGDTEVLTMYLVDPVSRLCGQLNALINPLI